MFALALAVALATTPAPKDKLAERAPKAVAEAQRGAPSAPMLTGVLVTLECTARASGRVEGCRVLEETHPGMGFGDAAVALMRDQSVAPGERDIQFARTIQFMP